MTSAAVATSRPLRAITILLFLWSGGRAAYVAAPLMYLTPKAEPLAARAIAADIGSVPAGPQQRRDTRVVELPRSTAAVFPRRTDAPLRASPERSRVPMRTSDSPAAKPSEQALAEVISKQPDARIDVGRQPGVPHQLSLSSWLLVRDGSAGITPAGTLGGAQIGARAYLPITPSIAATARFSTPLRTSGAEASVGLALQQGPLKLLLERRIALERGARNDFSATLAAGVDSVRLPRQFRLDAYGQAGLVGRDGFVDGAVRVDRRVLRHGKSEIALGAGVWGGAQPGIARVDAGPQVVVRTPVSGGFLRASGEWRQRIAGNAQPASGPALTLGMDF